MKTIGSRRKQLSKTLITGMKLKQVCSCCKHHSPLRSLLLYHQYFPAAHQPLEAGWPESLLCMCCGRAWLFLPSQLPSCSLKPPASCRAELITFQCLETWVASLKGSVGRAGAGRTRTITPFMRRAGVMEKEGTWNRQGLGTDA